MELTGIKFAPWVGYTEPFQLCVCAFCCQTGVWSLDFRGTFEKSAQSWVLFSAQAVTAKPWHGATEELFLPSVLGSTNQFVLEIKACLLVCEAEQQDVDSCFHFKILFSFSLSFSCSTENSLWFCKASSVLIGRSCNVLNAFLAPCFIKCN